MSIAKPILFLACCFGGAFLTSACMQNAVISNSASGSEVQTSALDAIIDAACHKKVVGIGVPGNHGGFNSVALSAQIATQLIDECHFRRVVIETPLYELPPEAFRLGIPEFQSSNDFRGAFSDFWRGDEFSDFLIKVFEKYSTGEIQVEGLDLQLSYRRNSTHPFNLASSEARSLQIGENKCDEMLGKILNEGSLEIGASGLKTASACLAKLSELKDWKRLSRNLISAMELERSNSLRDIRDSEMAENVLTGSSGAKTLIIAASVHISREAEGKSMTMGSKLAEQLGSQYYAVAVTASRGEYLNIATMQPKKIESMGTPLDSQHSRSSVERSIVVLDRNRLRQIGAVPTTVLSYNRINTFCLSCGLDAVVVLPEEQPSAR